MEEWERERVRGGSQGSFSKSVFTSSLASNDFPHLPYRRAVLGGIAARHGASVPQNLPPERRRHLAETWGRDGEAAEVVDQSDAHQVV